MEILVFRTDIKTKKKVKAIKPLFNNYSLISNWSVDTEDIDNVLRIETRGEVNENDIVHLIKSCGFYCEVMGD